MANLERVVKGTPEQLETILTEGSITVDDITVTREEIENNSTLFDTGRLDQMALNQQIKADMHRFYGYNHTAVVRQNLETVYNGIIADNPELADLSAVGFIALLKDGETVSKQGHLMFINGEEETEDYTFSGENTENGTEFIIVWYFSNNGFLNFATSTLSILRLAVVNNTSDNSTLNFGTNFYEQIETLIGYNYFFPSSSYAKCIELNPLHESDVLGINQVFLNEKNKVFTSHAKKYIIRNTSLSGTRT